MENQIIYAYTRKQAIADGVLVDVSELAKEAGVTIPVALTAAVWAEYVEIPACVRGCQDETGRLWDILVMFHFAARQHREKSRILFQLKVRNSPKRLQNVTLKAICGPGDQGEPVLTIMLPHED